MTRHSGCAAEEILERREAGLVRAFWVVVAIAVISGCTDGHSASPAEWTLDDGRTLGEWVAGEAAAAVLVMDPGECLRCQTVLGTWLKERARREGRMFLLFTRELGDTERRTLLAAGVRHDGVIREGGPSPESTPVEIVFHEGRSVYRAIRVYGPRSPLLERLEHESLEQFAAAPPTATADPQSAYHLSTSEGGDDE